MISWTAAHIFHVNAPLTAFWGGNSGSADCMFGWVMTFCLLVIATAATVVWSLLDRRRENYAGLHKWFRLFVRFALAGQMIIYGMVKVIPVQMQLSLIDQAAAAFRHALSHGGSLDLHGLGPGL